MSELDTEKLQDDRLKKNKVSSESNLHNGRILLETSDKKKTSLLLDQVKEFKVINYIVGDLGNDCLNQDPILLPTIDQSHFDQIIDMYNSSDYQLSITEQEQKAANITLEGLLKGLCFLEAINPLEEMYIAWLNHPSNIQKDVMHSISGDKILEIFNIQRFKIKEDDKVISELCSTHDGGPEYKEDGSLSDIAYMQVVLDKDAIAKIKNYNNRNHTHVSIQNLIDSGRMPAISNNKSLHLKGKNITSLYGLQNIENKESIEYLNLSHNFITAIGNNAFAGFSSLTTLYIRNNGIEAVEDNAFEGLSGLVNLSLSNNNITAIGENAFTNFKTLKYLSLTKNFLEDIKDNLFAQLGVLEELHLIDNKIEILKKNTFAGLDALRELYLDGNVIKTIEEDAFAGLNALKELYLGGNVIEVIEEDALNGLKALISLNLDRNKITTIVKNMFTRLDVLKYLHLAGNNITDIEDNAFAGLGLLEYLHLTDNRIQNVRKNGFVGLKALMSLYLKNNGTTDIEGQRFC